MSFIININNIKVYPILLCNICLQEKKKTIKCDQCNFNICPKCIYKWNKFNKTCPQCKFINTYNVEPKCKKINNIFKRVKLFLYLIKATFFYYFKNIKIYALNLTNLCIKYTFSKKKKILLQKTTLCFGTSLLFIIYLFFVLTLYAFMIIVCLFLLLFIIYLATCCCCCRHGFFLIKFF